MEIEKVHKLNYEIHNYSSFSSSYLPENIRDDNPQNQTSRWSSDSNTPTQFITLKLLKPAIVKYIKFGKYEKSHVCNLKKFKIFGGLEEKNMFQIFEGGLKNDNVPETFELKHKMYTAEDGERDIPIQYVQIVALLSFGPSFNFSIWYVELEGIENDAYVCERMAHFNDQREKQAIRLVLKHLRTQGYMNAFRALEKEAKINLEDNQITELFHALVEEGQFEKVENIMQTFIENGDANEYICQQKYKAKFTETNTADESNRPRFRKDAGYAYDEENQIVYMFGGSFEDISQDANDFWQFNLNTNEWSLIQSNCSISPRSGQKMVFDSISKQIFMIGRRASKATDSCKNDFYLYDVQTRTWLTICEDTSSMNGPSLLYEHQICLNANDRRLYVFGGKIVSKSDDVHDSYSGFYTYHINTNTWNLLYLDINHQLAANPEIQSVKSRINHCMLYDDVRRKIYIFAGQRGKELCNDFMLFDVESNTFANSRQATKPGTTVAQSSTSTFQAPDGTNVEKPFGLCFATIDTSKGEIYVLMKDNLWIYNLASNEFSIVHKSHPQSTDSPAYCKDTEISCIQGDINYFIRSKELFLNIFKLETEYSVQLQKPSRENILNYCKYMIRRQQYEEIARSNSLSALEFLRNNLSETIDKNDINQVNDFHKLASLLFCSISTINSADDERMCETSGQSKVRNQRTVLFNKLTQILPKAKCQPTESLLNFINI